MPPTQNIFCNFDGLNSPSLVVDHIFLLPACCTISTTLSCQCCRCDSSRYHFEGDCGLEWGVHRVDLPSPPGRRRLGGEEEEEPGGGGAASVLSPPPTPAPRRSGPGRARGWPPGRPRPPRPAASPRTGRCAPP